MSSESEPRAHRTNGQVTVPAWRYIVWVAIVAAIPLLLVLWNQKENRPGAPSRVQVSPTNYHGWSNAFILGNGKVEAVVVADVGRVMQFRFIGEEGMFWENPALFGRAADAADWANKDWVNFGGDKAWPAPEGSWPQITGRKSWRPPPAFDGMPAEARMEGGEVLLTSPPDPHFGIRVRRRVRLEPGQPTMSITTTFERLSGQPLDVSVWVVTQLKEPLRLFAPVPARSRFELGYTLISKEPPPDLQRADGLISLSRNSKAAHKIGADGDSLLWVGEKFALRIDAPRVAGAAYPDQGSSLEIYTNPDPLKYIELETLGPLQPMKPGDRIERTNAYTLLRRAETSPEAEARRMLGR
jgi:hypothetical protein